MKILSNMKKYVLQEGGLLFELLESGDIHRIAYENNQINLLRGNLIDGQASNIYLRIKENGLFKSFPLLGRKSNAKFLIENNKVIYQGNILGISYQIVLTVKKDRWYYDVLVKESNQNFEFDLVYGQDIAINSVWGVLSSESYTAQYIDHSVFKTDLGYVIQSRQNQGDPQFLQIGSLNKNIGYATDGFQVFGRNYKVNEIASGLTKDLENINYQYEFPYLSLQSELLDSRQSNSFTFYGYYEPLHDSFEKNILKVEHDNYGDFKWREDIRNQFNYFDFDTLIVDELDENFIDVNYQTKRHIETSNENKLLSFFTDNHTHVITKEKEMLVERQHGHLLISGDLLSGTENNFATTNWMFGVFASHIVLGNTNIQKLNSDLRNPLNIHKHSGMRIYIKIDNKYKILGTPNIYETGINYAKWIYKIEGDILEVISQVKLTEYVQRLTFKSKMNRKYDVLVTNQLVLGGNEYERDFELIKNGNEVEFTLNTNPHVKNTYPGLKYKFVSKEDVIFADDSLLFGSPKNSGILTAGYKNISNFTLDLHATFDEYRNVELNLEEDTKEYVSFINNLTGISFKHPDEQADLEQLTDTIFWYTHNALVHFASPHGLEQSNGAAWGTRDVSQGPVELFISAQRFDLVRSIILKVFSRQFIENNDFPQWFMFDKYFPIQAHESHGDIIVWPLKVLGDYIHATGDLSILNEKVSFMSMSENKWVEHDSTLMTHIERTLDAITKSFIKGTSLPAYGGGDWDDTLQPANKKLTDHMVSGWTPVLLYQALTTLSKELENLALGERCKLLKDNIKKDYMKYFIKDNVPAGFAVFEENQVDLLLHPNDKNTGLKYRLLPLTRSIIAELVDKEQALHNYELIEKNLKHPDGVRLMDTFVEYKGGQRTYFQRAETAANVGREIGIMYVHAHIRYIEAMAKLGKSEDAYEGLFTINPINITKHVKNAQIRQSNMYFSSSDAAFNDRYVAKKNFNLIKEGKIDVKGGWRLYSSGPGIYINQLIANIFGLRIEKGNLIIDPVLPKKLKGLEVYYHYQNRPLTVKYSNVCSFTKVMINGKQMDSFVSKLPMNTYRETGVLVLKDIIKHIDGPIKIELI